MNEDWAREVLADPRTVILDTETTGLRGYCCEIAVCDVSGVFLVDTLVNPLADVEPGARNVHGLTDEELAAAPPFAEVREKLGAALARRRVVVYNAEFDAAVIRRELARLDLPIPALGWECAMRRYSDWSAGYRDARFLRLNGGHRAREDCLAVIERLREMAA